MLAVALLVGSGIEPAIADHKPGHNDEGQRGEGNRTTTTIIPTTTTTVPPTTTAPPVVTTTAAAAKTPTETNTTTSTSTSTSTTTTSTTTTTTLAGQDEVVAFLVMPSGSPPNTTPTAVIPVEAEEEPVVGLDVSLGSTFVGLTVDAIAFPALAFVVPAVVAIWLSFKERRREPDLVEAETL
jgi:hypothetical protein